MRIGAMLACVVAAAGAAQAGPEVRLRYASFDPAVSVAGVPAELRAAEGSRLLLVQFARSPGDAERRALALAGCEVLQYIPDHAYVVWAPKGLDPGVVAGVRWAGAFHPAYKLDESILAALAQAEAVPARYGILLFGGGEAAQRRVDAALRSAGTRLDRLIPGSLRVEAVLTPAQALVAARLDEVHFIDPSGPPGTDMNIVRELSGANYLETTAGMSGQGVRGEVMDTSISLTHPSFQNPPPILHGPNGPNADHGNASYGIVFANDPAEPLIRGMLPDREQGIFATYTTVIAGGRRQHLEELVAPAGPYRGVFQSNGWGGPQVTTYSTRSAELDDDLLHVDIVLTQSQSNTGSQISRPEAWAKNVVSVGGFNHQDTLTRADDGPGISSFGPASDGRVKPDVVHVMDSVLTVANAPPPPGTTQISGTSASTPIVAGHVGLICQMWHEGVFPGYGGGASVFDDRPHAATTRALLFNATHQYDLWGTYANARFRQGWGMPDLRPLYDRAGRTFVVNEEEVLSALQSASYALTVPAGEAELRATMVYIDPPGSPAVQSEHRVNDLTLKVTSPSGVVYWGNHGLTNGRWSVPGGSADMKNVVENVFVQNPAAGEWTVEVSAPVVVTDAHLETPAVDADFALVVSGVEAGACYADCNGDGALNLADFGCFQTKFALQDPEADCNGDGALNLADFGCFQTAFALGCP